jgi:hexosaminidase
MGIIDLMLSVDSHYLNDPLPKTLFFLRKKRREYWEGGCYVERTCGAFEHRFKNIRTAAIERLWSNDTITDLNMHRRLKVISSR